MQLFNLIELKNGVYRVEENRITRLKNAKLLDNEKVLMFFLNKRCIHCLALVPEIEGLIKHLGKKEKQTPIILVVCDWFSEECSEENAKKLFKEYEIESTPTILLLVKNPDGFVDKIYVDASSLHTVRKLL